jgi:hypothetical protein
MHYRLPLRAACLRRLAALAPLGVLAAALAGAVHAEEAKSHAGPTITAFVVRGDARLPIHQVAHLRKGDRLLVNAAKSAEAQDKWLLVLATVSPSGNKVTSQQFDLSASTAGGAIDILADDAVPIIVLAPQVRTLFGLSTSFGQSASLITEALAADPQRFVDLQKLDQINHAITSLSAGLDAVVQGADPARAVDSAKAMAAKFGVKAVDPACFKDGAVNTKCVASSIVSNKDLTVPSVTDLGVLAGPFASADLSPDLLTNVRLFSAASSFLANKYRDQYDFAPSSSNRQDGDEALQLYASARFKNGAIKTAYVYVPSWFNGKAPELSVASAAPACLSRGELAVSLSHSLPVSNYWHDWELVLGQPGASEPLVQTAKLVFKPEKSMFVLDFKDIGKDLALDGQTLEASIKGRFSFSGVATKPFKVVLPRMDHLQEQLVGLDQLIAGEQPSVRLQRGQGSCVESLDLVADGVTLATSAKEARDVLKVDLRNVAPGEARLRINQFGVEQQQLVVRIQQKLAHVQRAVHYDLDGEIAVTGTNLERIAAIRADGAECRPLAPPDDDGAGAVAAEGPLGRAPGAPSTRLFACPPPLSANARLPAKLTVTHLEQEPVAFQVVLTKLDARPRMRVAGARDPLRTVLSPKAQQWGLPPDGALVSDDSGLSLLLRAVDGYRLGRGSFNLQLKFADDPVTEQTPISVSLIADRTHNELRTRAPVSFPDMELPGVVNPILYRVQNQQNGYVGEWRALERSVVALPKLGALSCAPGGGMLLHGAGLEQIDWASTDTARSTAPANWKSGSAALAGDCENEQCVAIGQMGAERKLRIKLHWIDKPLFDAKFADAPSCAGAK